MKRAEEKGEIKIKIWRGEEEKDEREGKDEGEEGAEDLT